MSEAYKVINVEISKMKLNDGDTIVIRLSGFKFYTMSKLKGMLEELKEHYPNNKVMILDIDDKVTILEKK